MKALNLKLGKKEIELLVAREGDTLVLKTEEGGERRFKVIENGEELILERDGAKSRVFVHREGERVWATKAGEPYAGERFQPDHTTGSDEDASHADLVAPMNGRVVSVLAEAGQEVAEGDGVVVIEAMKMEHKLTAPFDAKVETLNAKEGQQVDMNELLAHLVRLEADEE